MDSEKTIDELRAALKKAEDGKAGAEAIIAAIGDGITIQDRDFRILYQNQVAINLIGNHVGEYCYAAYEGSDSVCEGCPVAMSFQDGNIHTQERSSTTDKGIMHVEITASVLRDSKGNITAGIEVVRDVTQRRRTEEALNRSESRYRILAEAAHDIIFVINREDRIEYINSFGAGLFELQPEDILGRAREDLFPGAPDAKRIGPRDVFETGLPLYSEDKTLFPGGEMWLSTLLVPMRDEQGNVATVMGIARDITERKRAEDLLRKSEEQYRLLFKGNPNPMWVYDRENLSFLAVNVAAVQHYGYSREEFLGMTIRGLHPSEDQGIVDGIVKNIRGEYRKVGIWQHRKKDGELIDVDIVTHDIEFNGRHARLVLVHDVTTRRKAEESLYESESKLRAITDTAMDAILLIDEEENVVYWNPSASRVLGYSPAELMGRSVTAIIPERFRDAHVAAFRRFVESGEGARLGRTYETFAKRKDGVEVPVELSISGIRLKGKWHAAGIIRDISGRKKLEDQLLHSQKMEAVGQLSGGVAHDFNNILSAIIGYGHILLMKMRDDDPLRPNVEHILASADRAAHLTRSLLAFSRKQVLSPRTVDLNEIIGRVGSILLHVIGEDIELRTVFRQDTVTVNADSGQLEQVLMNLATNARDAMPRGGSFTLGTDTIELDQAFIRAHGYGEPGRYAVIAVADSGTGMDEETRKRIFEPFFTTKETGKGTGLGLSIVYGIIKQHKGYINVYSEPGLGTTFKIYLPLFETKRESGRSPERVPEEALPRGTETVLVAEDDEALRKLTRTVLEEFGYTVIAAEDGEDAVRKFTERRDEIQAVILDMIMPKKSGKEAYEKLKKIKPGIKALFVSGYTADKMHLEPVPGEGVELLMKPISPKVLVKKVRELLDK